MTSKPWLPRLAASESLASVEHSVSPAEQAINDRILSALGRSGQVFRLDHLQQDTGGYFRVECAVSEPGFFVKFVSPDQIDRQTAAIEVAIFARSQGISTPCLLDGFPKQMPGGQWMLAYPYLDGRPVRPEDDECADQDFKRLGETIGKLHTALAGWPGAKSVKSRTAARHRMLQSRLDSILRGDPVPGPVPGIARSLAEKHPEGFQSIDADARMIHGDLNIGNILFDSNDDPVILDFEESLGAWYPVSIDILYLMERLIWSRIGPDETARTMAQAFIDGYRISSGAAMLMQAGQVQDTIEWLALRSFLIMIESAERGTVWPDSEWNKFQTLLGIAEDRKSVLHDIETRLLAA